MLDELRIDEHALVTVTVDDQDVVLVPVGGGVYAAWNCRGEATYLYAFTAEGLVRIRDAGRVAWYARAHVRARAARARYIAQVL